MAEYLSPGVYVEEVETGGRPIAGVSTSTAGFIGLAERGRIIGEPVLITSMAEFGRKFGGYLSESEYGEYRFLPYSVEHFFINGGARCYIMRVAAPNAKAAAAGGKESCISISAKDPGTWGNKISILIAPSSKAKTQILDKGSDGASYILKNPAGFNEGDIVQMNNAGTKTFNRIVSVNGNTVIFETAFDDDVTDKSLVPAKVLSTCEFNMQVRFEDTVETYELISFNIKAVNFIDKKTVKSELVDVKFTGSAKDIVAPFNMIAGDEADEFAVVLNGGTNGDVGKVGPADFIGTDNGPGKRSGIQSFIDNNQVSIMAVPGITDPNVQLSLVAHCENTASRFAVLDIPRDSKKVEDVLKHREFFDTEYAALYHPWLEVYDMLDRKNIMIPPSGSIVGIYARTDLSRGVHKAPANETVFSCVGLDCQYNTGEQDILNPKGVNLIRSFPGQGIKVWGARTCTSNTNWKYVNVRRFFIFLEESIKANTNWAVFEPNDEMLWVRVKRSIEVFLANLWRNGSLAGSSEGEAFFVDVGRTTMTDDDIDNGRLICIIGVAPVKPAEFVIFRISQKTNEAASA